MWIRRGFAFISATALFFLATSASADEFCHCDADVKSCYCPSSLSSPYDSCDSMDVSNMVTPDEPSALREAANIQMTYDSQTDTYTITADVRDLNAGGALPIHSNRGQWSSVTKFRNYMEDLLGQDYPIDCFERVRMKQVGTLRRIDQSEGDLAASGGMHVVLAAITGPSGEIVIDADEDGSTLDQNFVTLGGRTSNRRKECKNKTSGDLGGRQCSYITPTKYQADWIGDVCEPSSAGSVDEVFYEMGGGYLFNPTWEGEETTSRCIYWSQDKDPFKKCKYYLNMKVKYESADIENLPYKGGTTSGPISTTSSTDTESVSNHFWGVDGVCSSGQGDRGGYTITPETRIGAPSDCHTNF